VSGFVRSDQSFERISGQMQSASFGRPTMAWWLAIAGSLGLIGVLAISVGYLFYEGVGIWGNNIPVTWALDIVGYDWWIGIATGALGLSAMLHLTDRAWGPAIARTADTVAVLAAAAAAIYPIIHLGRPWFFYWNLPTPNTMELWPQFRSPLYWDAVDILGYLTVSLTFWYSGLLPDLAGLRDRAIDRIHDGTGSRFARRVAQLYGIAALGWRGSATHWHRRAGARRLIAMLGLLVVVSLQTGAAVMFAGSLEPGWHDTLRPVEFLVAALFSGVAATSVVIVVVRQAFGLGGLITENHLDRLAWTMLALGLLDLYCTGTGLFSTLVGGDSFAVQSLAQRLHGPHAWAFWTMVGAALLPAHLFWLRSARQSPPLVLIIGALVCVGSWADHFMVIVDALQHDFLPSADHPYSIGLWGAATFAGSCGLFCLLLLLAIRLLPVLAVSDVKALSHLGSATSRTPVSSDRIDLPKDAPLWGIAAEYAKAPDMIRAASDLRRHGLGRIDLYSPLRLPDAEPMLRLARRPVHPLALAALVGGGIAMLGLCLYATGYNYVFNIGGRPRFSWPAFVVPSVSFAMLCGALVAFVALLIESRLPRLNHPAFNIPGIGGVTRDRFFLLVHEEGDTLDAGAVERAIAGLDQQPLIVHRVPR
jgi:Ni/Fe-hydrogenase subunit HybB-like protein